MSRKSTALDVARAAGVSKWTVMRAFKPGASIAESSRQRVIEAADRLDYRPNLVARSLATRITQQVAVLVDDFANPYKLPTLARLCSALQAEDMVVMLININQDIDYVDALLNAGQRQVDAIVLFATCYGDEMLNDRRLSAGAPPMFVIARESTIPALPSVACDSLHSMNELCTYLYDKGYRRPGFMTGPKPFSSTIRRHGHFLAFWEQRGVPVMSELPAGAYDRQSGEQAMRDFLAHSPAGQLDVLMCENDILAMGAVDAAREKLRIPQDLAIVGYDGLEITGAPAYALTTYEQPAAEMVRLLVDMITGRMKPTSVQLKGRLLARDSA